MKYDSVIRCEQNHLCPDHYIKWHIMACHLHWSLILQEEGLMLFSTLSWGLYSSLLLGQPWDETRLLSALDLESLQVWRLHSLCGQPLLPLLGSSHSEKVFPHIQSKFLLFQIMSITISRKSIPHSTCLLTSVQTQNIFSNWMKSACHQSQFSLLSRMMTPPRFSFWHSRLL